MAVIPLTYLNTISVIDGGQSALSGSGMTYRFTLTLTGTAGEATLILTDNQTGEQIQAGAGYVTGVAPSWLFAFNNKNYALAGAVAYFTAINAGDVWNDPSAAGNGFIEMGNFSGAPDTLQSAAVYQGKLAFIFRRFIQIWSVDPDPALYVKNQELQNIGTVAPLSVKSVGDMDIFMLADNGVRSVRVRDASNNAVIADVGTPIDDILQPILSALTEAEKAAACGVVEPSSNRYWCYIPAAGGAAGKIYVFSYFPSSEITAWGTYLPTYKATITAPASYYTGIIVTYTGLTIGKRYFWTPGAHEVEIRQGNKATGLVSLTSAGSFIAVATTAEVVGTGATVSYTGTLAQMVSFIPEKFCVLNGQVYARGGDHLLLYGGADNQTYDGCGVNVDLPYLDCDAPATMKDFRGVDAAFEGTWQVGFSSDYISGDYKLVYANTIPSYHLGKIPLNRKATHFSLQFTEDGADYARISHAIVHFTGGSAK